MSFRPNLTEYESKKAFERINMRAKTKFKKAYVSKITGKTVTIKEANEYFRDNNLEVHHQITKNTTPDNYVYSKLQALSHEVHKQYHSLLNAFGIAQANRWLKEHA